MLKQKKEKRQEMREREHAKVGKASPTSFEIMV